MKAALSGAVTALAALVLTVAPATAADGWTALQSRGTVFVLLGEKWEEVVRNQLFSGEQIVRTLPSGRLSLQGEDGQLDLGGGTAIQFDGHRITQYSGTIVATNAPGATLLIIADDALVTVRGKVELRVDGEDLLINVITGTATLDDPSSGKTVALSAGQTVDSNGVATAAANGQGAPKAGSANASANSAGNANANAAAAAGSANSASNGNAAGGGGNSSAASSGNAGGNGADNGNAGGNGGDNGNAGGNGNGNAGGNGNGNGNAGGNGNGNAGGNGNGNGNAGGNGNGNGNGN